MPPELGDHAARFVTYGDIVNAAPVRAVALPRFGDQAHAKPGRRGEGDVALLSDRPKAIRIAGKCQGAVRQREYEAAVPEAVPVDHALGHRHSERCTARSDGENFHAQTLARLVIGPQRLGAQARNFSPVLGHAGSPLNLGTRFSRKAVTPSCPSADALARFCRSRSRSS